ncbi:hypothetical protein FACS1894161_0030 [Spirochaetia bacterium]|nr:hypothetical protein FACS1894161_0030 [Spirochaetia bacterium]
MTPIHHLLDPIPQKVEYEQAIREGRLTGGGSEKWEEMLDFIIRTFEYIVIDEFGSEKEKRDCFIKWYGMSPFDEIKNNEYYHYDYEKDGHNYIAFETPPEGTIVLSKRKFYVNHELLSYIESQVEIGVELFGKYFRNFWD